MSISLAKMNSTLTGVNTRVPAPILNAAASDVINDNNTIQFSTLGKEAGEEIAGMIGLTQETDEGYEADIIKGIGLVQMGPNVPSIQPDIVGDPSGNASEIDLITGGSGGSKPGLKFEFFGGSSIEAIAAILALASGKDPRQLVSILQLLTAPDLKGRIQSALETTIQQTFAPVLAQFNAQMVNLIGGSIVSVLENLADRTDGPISNILQGLADGTIPPQKMVELVQAISDKNYNYAISEMIKLSSEPIEVIESTILNTSTALPDRIQRTDNFASLPNFKVGSTATSWAGAQTNTVGQGSQQQNVLRNGKLGTVNEAYTFSAISSMEELEAELRAATREITETVVHWSANYIDQDIGARQLHNVALQRGFAGCSYHYVIRRDGIIERGRPINLKGAHAKANGHNNFSIGVAFVAGYNCLSGTPNPERYVSHESISMQQWKTLDQYLTAFYKVFPGGQVFGHNDTDPGRKVDPGIDMAQYIRNKFNKQNVLAGTSAPVGQVLLAELNNSSTFG